MASDIERQLAALAAEPRTAGFARRLSDVLAGIRRDFQGEVRRQLEEVVAETLARQLVLVESRGRADAALSDLQARQEELSGMLYEILLHLVPDDDATRH